MSEPAATAEKKRQKRKKKKTVRKLFVTAVVLCILGIAGFVTVRKLQADYRIIYDPYTAATGSITNSLNYSGTMQLVSNKMYTSPSDAKVREIYVTEGSRVEQGDKLMRLSDGTTLSAEFDGTVNRILAEKGDEVKNNSNLIQLVDFDHMQVSFRIGESNVRDVAAGQAVLINVASVSAAFEANIKSIDYSSYSGNNVAYYTAVADVDTSAVDYIYPGMQATITMVKEEAKDAVILKMDAISTAQDNTAFVYVQDEDGNMREQAITVGISNGNFAEIRSGLKDGDIVYAVRKEEQTSFAGILAEIFGNTRVNTPTGGFGNNRQGSWPSDSGSGGNGNRPSNSNGGGNNRQPRGQ